jgi:hypothetical protein
MSFTLIRFLHYSVYCFPGLQKSILFSPLLWLHHFSVPGNEETRLLRGRGGKCEGTGGVRYALLGGVAVGWE